MEGSGPFPFPTLVLDFPIYKKGAVVLVGKGYEDDLGTGASDMWMRDRELELVNIKRS